LDTLLEYFPPENIPFTFGGLWNCWHEGGCIPHTKSSGYTNPNEDSKGFLVFKIPAEGDFRLPMAIKQDELEYHRKMNDGK